MATSLTGVRGRSFAFDKLRSLEGLEVMVHGLDFGTKKSHIPFQTSPEPATKNSIVCT